MSMAWDKLPIFDGHNDVLLRLYLSGDLEGRTFFEESPERHLDLPRAKQAGFAGGLFAVFIPKSPDGYCPPPSSRDLAVEAAPDLPLPLGLDRSQEIARQQMKILHHIEHSSAGQVKLVRTPGELDESLRQGTLAAVMHFEGAEPLDPELEALEEFYRDGLRSIGIVWSRPNAFGQGVPFRYPSSPDTGPGLTGTGRDLVRACNRLGILVDLAHINEKGFWDVAAMSEAPLVSSHCCAHALCPSSRNLTDKQLAAIRESGGMVGVSFGVNDIRPDGKRDQDTPVEWLVNQIDYLVEKLGIDGVGLGSDFDGTKIPNDIGHVGGLGALFSALRRRGYDETSLSKLACQNWQAMLRKAWKNSVLQD